MPNLDTTAKAALDAQVIVPVQFIYLDVLGDPIRVTTGPSDVVLSGTGDSDLDGKLFSAVDPQVIEVGEVTHSESGSETLSVHLSGLIGIDTDLLNGIGDVSKWRTRLARLWMRVHNETGDAQGAIFPYYTGYMSSVVINPSPESQTIELKIENYLAAFNAPSNRSYLNQKDYDAGDNSAAATISSANGSRAQNVGGGAPVGGGGGGAPVGGGGGGSFGDVMRSVVSAA